MSRPTQRKHKIADAQAIRFRQSRRLQPGVNAQQRQIMTWVAANQFGVGAAASGQADFDVVVALNHVVGGNDQILRPGDARGRQAPARFYAQHTLGGFRDQVRHRV